MPKSTKKNILLNNLGEKHILLMKFSQFIKFYQTTQQKLPPEIYFHTLLYLQRTKYNL